MTQRTSSLVTDEHWTIIENMVRMLRERGLSVSSLEIQLESTRRLGGGVHTQTGVFTRFEREPVFADLERESSQARTRRRKQT